MILLIQLVSYQGGCKLSDTNRIKTLDSLRGIAALIVLIHHCLLTTPAFNAAHYHTPYHNWFVSLFTNSILHTVWAGHEAVILFFMLSGFVLALPFLKKDIPYRGYIIARIFRIYLPYITVMVIACLLMATIADYQGQPHLIAWFSEKWDHALSMRSAISYIFMLGYDTTNVDGPTWSLVHEMRISLFFPVLMLLVIKTRWSKALVIGLSACFAGWCGFFVLDKLAANTVLSDLLTSFKDTCFYTVFFVIGAVFAKYREQVGLFFSRLGLTSKGLLLLAALALININGTFFFLRHGIIGKVMDVSLLTDLLVAPGVLILFCFAIFSKPAINALTKPVFLWLGEVSYSLYLTHVVVLITTMYTLGMVIPVYLALAIVPIIALVVAQIVNRLIEIPAQKLGRRFSTQSKQHAMPRNLAANKSA